jgi:hypothetical protein
MTASHGNPNAGDGAVKNPVEARQGVTTGRVRWMLRISLVLGVLALGAVFIGYTASEHAPTMPAPATASAHQNPSAS